MASFKTIASKSPDKSKHAGLVELVFEVLVQGSCCVEV